MSQHKLQIECSDEQREYIINHLLTGRELVIHHAERTWIANCVHKRIENGAVRIVSADLDIDDGKGTWNVVVTHEY